MDEGVGQHFAWDLEICINASTVVAREIYHTSLIKCNQNTLNYFVPKSV